MRYFYEPDDSRKDSLSDKYENIFFYLRKIRGLDTYFSQEGNDYNFYFKGDLDSLRQGLEPFFEMQFRPKIVEVDKSQYPFNWLGNIWHGFRSSTRKGHTIAVEMLKERKFVARRWYKQQGHLAYSILELPD